MKRPGTWNFIYKNLLENIPVMLLYVLESKGSSPGRQGFFMAVNATGEMDGSIGGGIMEHKFVEMAKERLGVESREPGVGSRESGDGSQESGDGSREPGIRKQIHNKSAATDQSGMICSGEQTIFLYPVTIKDKDSIHQLIQSLEVHKNGTLQLSPKGFSFSSNIPANDFQFTMSSENDPIDIGWSYAEKTGYKNQLFIIGGGHCALAFSKLMRGMDFYITLFEEREGLNTLVQNEFAHEVIIVDDYTALSNMIPAGPHQYVVIMTFGYRTDDVAIRSLLDKQFRYIGVLGSKKKMEKLFDDYKKEGIDKKVLQRIHTPIGLSINSQTPEEIAISIAAEIIKIKNS